MCWPTMFFAPNYMHNERVPKHKNLCWFFGFFSVPREHVTWCKEPVGFTKRKPAVFSLFFFFSPCDTHWVSSGYPRVVMGFFVGKNCANIVICKAQGDSILWEAGPCLDFASQIPYSHKSCLLMLYPTLNALLRGFSMGFIMVGFEVD